MIFVILDEKTAVLYVSVEEGGKITVGKGRLLRTSARRHRSICQSIIAVRDRSG